MIKPNKLKKGDMIAVVALSWNGNEFFPHIVDKGIERLEKEFGFKVKRGNTLNMTNDELYNNPKTRAKELHEQFLDKDVKGIISLIGGSDSIRVLPFLDKDIILNNPKFFMGFSDTTTFNAYLNKLGLVTCNGPAVMAGFAESLKLEDDFVEHINEFLFQDWNEFRYKKFNRYVFDYLDWSDSDNLEKENINYLDNSEGWSFVQGNQVVEGELFGGCMEVLEFMKGTKFWPDENFWNNKILFFEISEDLNPTPKHVEYWLRNYGMQGILNKVNGILFGRPKNFSNEDKQGLNDSIQKILKEFDREDMPVITNMDFGHSDPQFIMPNGIKAEINPIKKSFKLVESIWNN